MKMLLTTTLMLLGLTAFADTSILVQGAAAENLYKSLVAAGSVSDCGAGTCGTEVTDVQVVMTGNSVNDRHYTSSLKNQDSQEVEVKTVGENAKNLFDALVGAGMQSDCGAGTCSVESAAIKCLARGNSTGDYSYECEVSN